MAARDATTWENWQGRLEQAMNMIPPGWIVIITDIDRAIYWKDSPRGEWLYDPRRFLSGMRPRDLLEHVARYEPDSLTMHMIWHPREGWNWCLFPQPSGCYSVHGGFWRIDLGEHLPTIDVAQWLPYAKNPHLLRCPQDGDILNIIDKIGNRFIRECDTCGYQESDE